MVLIFVITFFIAFATTYLATPFVKQLALRVGAVDLPDARKVHSSPIPRWGGLALAFGIGFSLFLVLEFIPSVRFRREEISNFEFIGIIGACLLMLILGMIDDLKPLPAKVKLFFQILASFWLVQHGVHVSFITNPFSHKLIYFHKYLTYLISIFWIIGVTNALNLLDGLDGLLSGISTISSLALLGVALEKGYFVPALILIAMAGGTLAFLRYNFNPAQIFLGDAGSLFLGMLWASISIAGALKTPTVAVFIPLLILGIPIADTLFAILRRFRKGEPIFKPDKEHLHHRLLRRGWSQKKAVIALYLLSGILGTIAILINHYLK